MNCLPTSLVRWFQPIPMICRGHRLRVFLACHHRCLRGPSLIFVRMRDRLRSRMGIAMRQ